MHKGGKDPLVLSTYLAPKTFPMPRKAYISLGVRVFSRQSPGMPAHLLLGMCSTVEILTELVNSISLDG